MDAYVQDIMSSMGTAAAGMEGVTYKIKEASGEAVVNKDGYFSSMKIKMLMDMEVQGKPSASIWIQTLSTATRARWLHWLRRVLTAIRKLIPRQWGVQQ